jgi:hypothetical protein
VSHPDVCAECQAQPATYTIFDEAAGRPIKVCKFCEETLAQRAGRAGALKAGVSTGRKSK